MIILISYYKPERLKLLVATDLPPDILEAVVGLRRFFAVSGRVWFPVRCWFLKFMFLSLKSSFFVKNGMFDRGHPPSVKISVF